jgi:hypothetical protein
VKLALEAASQNTQSLKAKCEPTSQFKPFYLEEEQEQDQIINRINRPTLQKRIL